MSALSTQRVRRSPAPALLWLGAIAAIAVFVVIAARAAAGGPDEIVETGPPTLSASVGGQNGPLGLGSYSWQFDGSPISEDAAGIVTTAQVLTVTAGEELRIAGAGDLNAVEAYAFVRGQDSSSQEGANRLSWRAPGAPTPLVVNQGGGTLALPIDLSEGQYVISIAIQADGGNAVYGLQIDVEAAH